MHKSRKIVSLLFAGLLLVGTMAGCGDDAGEDRIGDGEINDEGD